MYIHLLEQGLLQWEPLVLLTFCWLAVGQVAVDMVVLVVEQALTYTAQTSTYQLVLYL
jgi:hypothetical protein